MLQTNGEYSDGWITFFVGILSFMNSASRHKTFQGAWIFKKPIPGILLWNKTKVWRFKHYSLITHCRPPLYTQWISKYSNRQSTTLHWCQSVNVTSAQIQVFIAAYEIVYFLPPLLCKTSPTLPDSFQTLELGTLTYLDIEIHNS